MHYTKFRQIYVMEGEAERVSSKFSAELGNWIKGESGQTCNEVCQAVGKQCNAEAQSSLDTNEKVAAAFLEAGYTCKSFVPNGRDYAGTPFSTGRSRDDCAPMKTSGKKSVCNGNRNRWHAPLCFCTGTQYRCF